MLTPWVSRIIFANVGIFLAQMFLPGARDLIEYAGVLVPSLLPYRPWSIVTYMFLHAGFGHLFWNMLSLYFFGPRLEAELSGGKFLGLYLVSGIAGGLLSWVFTPNAAIVGASGAIFGVMLGYARFWPRDQMLLMFVPMPVWVAVLVMTVLNLFGGFGGGGGNTAHFAHLGGFVGAFGYLLLVERSSRQRKFEAKVVKGPKVSRGDLDRWAKIRRDELHEVNREELDRIMRKIEEQGTGSVTPQERSFLDNFSDRAGS
jgi:membrane associated rhomboid family serine protease